MIYPLKGKKIWVAGHNGMVGSALLRRLKAEKCQPITADRQTLDLTNQSETQNWIAQNKPDAILMAAARVGGIKANSNYPAEFIYENLAIQTNIIHAAYLNKTEKLLFLGSSCIYPKEAKQPITEDALLTGTLEPTNEAYAIAKITGIKMCQAYRKQYGCDFISIMPPNLYGPNDNYDIENSHVVAAMIKRFSDAKKNRDKTVTIWGSGKPLREIMHVDDLADAAVFIIQHYSDLEPINCGSGEEVSILNLAHLVAEIIGYKGNILSDETQPDGVTRKLLDNSKLNALGWKSSISLKKGLEQVCNEALI